MLDLFGGLDVVPIRLPELEEHVIPERTQESIAMEDSLRVRG
jgi:hypothetical protein